jgi:hypothetical protein
VGIRRDDYDITGAAVSKEVVHAVTSKRLWRSRGMRMSLIGILAVFL